MADFIGRFISDIRPLSFWNAYTGVLPVNVRVWCKLEVDTVIGTLTVPAGAIVSKIGDGANLFMNLQFEQAPLYTTIQDYMEAEVIRAKAAEGDLTTLTTTDKTSLVAAINEGGAAATAHIADVNNPHDTTKLQVGLGNVDDTADLAKPISTLTQTALDGKVAKAGDTMTGALTLNAAPTADNMAATKKYVDDEISSAASKSFEFKGFITDTAPTVDVREGNMWLNATLAADVAPSLVFPWTVANYESGAWSAATVSYTPIAMDLWLDSLNNEAWYYVGNQWNRLDFDGSAFDADFFETAAGEITLKAGSIADASIAANAEIAQAKIADLPEDLELKADKVLTPTAGDLATLDADGNLTDSGIPAVNVNQNLSQIVDTTAYTSLLDMLIDKKMGFWSINVGTYNGYTDLPPEINPPMDGVYFSVNGNPTGTRLLVDAFTTAGKKLSCIISVNDGDYITPWTAAGSAVGYPDYSKIENINRINAAGGSWTVDRDGYVICSVNGSTGGAVDFLVNGKFVSSNQGAISSANGFGQRQIFPVKQGDLIRINFTGTVFSISCNFVPPIMGSVVPVNNLITMGPPDFSTETIMANSTVKNTLLQWTVVEPGWIYFYAQCFPGVLGDFLSVFYRVDGKGQQQYILGTNAGYAFWKSEPIQVAPGTVVSMQVSYSGSGNNFIENIRFLKPKMSAPVYLEPGPVLDYIVGVEQDTGRKWINGQPIYQNTLNLNLNIIGAQWTNIGTVASILPGASEIIDSVARFGTTGSHRQFAFRITSGNIECWCAETSSSSAITFWYVK